ESLRSRLNREKLLPVDEALRLSSEVAGALDYAHRHQIVHRDIKPENILLEEGQAVVADFGIARALQAAEGGNLTETGVALGTATYMSPEQATADQLDGRSDIYSLGCVLYEMLAGEPPYSGPTAQAIIAKRFSEPIPHVRTLRETVSEAVAQALQKALARAPADRFATASEMASALAGVSPSRGALSGRSWRMPSVAASGVVVITVAAWMISRGHSAPTMPGNTLAVLPFRVAGSVVGGNRSVRLSAAIRDLRRGTDLGTEQVEGSADSVPALVDRLTVLLLRAGLGRDSAALPAFDLARPTTTSLVALKAFLA